MNLKGWEIEHHPPSNKPHCRTSKYNEMRQKNINSIFGPNDKMQFREVEKKSHLVWERAAAAEKKNCIKIKTKAK